MTVVDSSLRASATARLPTWHGIIPPLLTPLQGPDTLDVAGLERLVGHLVAGGMHGLFVLGTTGEGPCLSRRLARELVARTRELARGRVPLLVGVSDSSPVECVARMREAAEAGADAVVATPPFYLPLAQDEFVRYFHCLAAQSPLPLFIYNMPALTKIAIEPASVTRLLEVENIVGLKDSSGNKEQFLSLVAAARARPGWPVFVGHEHLLVDALRGGAAGGVCAGANIFAQSFAELYAALRSGNDTVVEAFQQASALRRQIYGLLDRGTPGTIRTLKAAAALLRLCRDEMTEPFEKLSPAQLERLAALLTQAGVSVASPIHTA